MRKDDSDFSLSVFIGEDGVPNLLIHAGRHLTVVNGEVDLPPEVRQAVAGLIRVLYDADPYLVLFEGDTWFDPDDDQQPM
jgi:hypothetical protein